MKKTILALAALLTLAAVIRAEQSLPVWDGPTDGPKAVPSKRIVFLASDFKNGGVTGVYRGVESAARTIGWQISYRDGEGRIDKLGKEFSDIMASPPDAVILAGFQPEEFQEQTKKAVQMKVVLVGWHAAANPGPTQYLFVNIATDSKAVALTAASFAISQSAGKAGIVIFNDSRFAVANEKTRIMKEMISNSPGCRILAVENIPINDAAAEVPKAVSLLNKKFGRSWTHSLAVNDVYFDNINYPLQSIGRNDIVNISAGDGSMKAILRIKSESPYQTASVAEPLLLQGWQIIDELNRAFSGKPSSGYKTKPLLITPDYLRNFSPRKERTAEESYKKAYQAIWRK